MTGSTQATSTTHIPVLGALLAEDLASFHPHSLVVAGSATGLDAVNPAVTRFVLALAADAEALALLALRHARRLRRLELVHGNVLVARVAAHSADLVHAALVLESLPAPGAAAAVARMAEWLRPAGVLSLVLQRSREGGVLAPARVDGDVVVRAALDAGLHVESGEFIGLTQGRGYRTLRFRRD